MARALPHEPRPVLRGSPSARVLIAGQAPGTRVHASGLPFTDPSGVRLRGWMGVDAPAFYDESRFAILPMGFCFPGQDERGADLPPRRECAPAWRAALLATLPDIRLTLAIGRYAIGWHLAFDAPLAEIVHTQPGLDRARPILALPHPSWRNTGWLKAHPWFEAETLPRLRRALDAAFSAPDAG